MRSASFCPLVLLGCTANALPGLKTRGQTGGVITGETLNLRQNSENGIVSIPLKKWRAHNADLQVHLVSDSPCLVIAKRILTLLAPVVRDSLGRNSAAEFVGSQVKL